MLAKLDRRGLAQHGRHSDSVAGLLFVCTALLAACYVTLVTSGGCEMEEFLNQRGVRVSPEWTAQWQQHHEHTDASFLSKPVNIKQAMLWQEVLQSDLNVIGAQALPSDLQAWHKRQLQGLFVLQADEITNIAAAAKYRYLDSADKRCLRLVLTDGATQVIGLEYAHIKNLHALMPAGVKLAVKDATVRRGTLLLTSDNTAVLGGQVEALEKARQKAIKRWNQPATGRTSRHDTGPVDLFAEAAAAAWREDPEPSASLGSASQVGAASRPASDPSNAGRAHPAPRAANFTASSAAPQALPSRLASAARQQSISRHPSLVATPLAKVQHQSAAAGSSSQPNAGNANGSGSSLAAGHLSSRAASTAAQGHLATSRAGIPDSMATQPYQAGAASMPVGENVVQQPPQQPSGMQSLANRQMPHVSRLSLPSAPRLEDEARQHDAPMPTPLQQSHARWVQPSTARKLSSGPAHQELIVLDDSPQLPRQSHRQQPDSHDPSQLPRPHLEQQHSFHDTDEVMADADAHEAAAATQSNARHNRGVVESSSDSEQDHGRTAAAANTATLPQEHLDAEKFVPNPQNGDCNPVMHAAYGNGIIPDTSFDAGPMLEEAEDYEGMYGNEPNVDEGYDEQADQLEEQQRSEICNAHAELDTDAMDEGEMSSAASIQPAAKAGIQDAEHTTGMYQCDTAAPNSSRHAQIASAAAQGSAKDHEATASYLEAMQGLFATPHTSLRLMQQLLPMLPEADFPLTLRVNGKLTKPLSKLEFKDASNQPLAEYAIRMELQDATCSCAAVVGHDILLEATGVTPAQFTSEFLAQGKQSVICHLKRMNDSMAQYFKAYTLMDIVLQTAHAEPVIVTLHDSWTTADKAALG